MKKRGKRNPSWKVRWFTMTQDSLVYFKNKGDVEPIGEISLRDCVVVRIFQIK